MPRISITPSRLAVAAALCWLSSSAASAQDFVVEGLSPNSTNSILRVQGLDKHLEHRSGTFGLAPGTEFKFGSRFAALFFLAPDASGPERLVVRTEGLDFDPVAGADFRVLSDSGGIVLASDNPSQRYLVDANDNDGAANHIWYENKVGQPGDPVDFRMMQLTEEAGGTLYVDGPVVQNHTFDLAETFWESEEVAPAELVAIDPDRPNAVRRAVGAYQRTVLGVASTSPGFLLGGAPFSLADLEETWGREIVDEYLEQRRVLELEVLAELPDLEVRSRRLASLGSYLAHVEQLELDAALDSRGGAAWPASDTSPEQLAAAYQAALHDFETTMFDRTLGRFFRERFSAVALAGRVPVKVDASFGAIFPGDYLTSSPVPGAAMKASAPGPIVGTALESHSGGSGVIEVFVHRGWYGGSGSDVAGLSLASRGLTPDPRDLRIADLERRLAALERTLVELAPSRLAGRIEVPDACRGGQRSVAAAAP